VSAPPSLVPIIKKRDQEVRDDRSKKKNKNKGRKKTQVLSYKQEGEKPSDETSNKLNINVRG
jgi:hypothetical protein